MCMSHNTAIYLPIISKGFWDIKWATKSTNAWVWSRFGVSPCLWVRRKILIHVHLIIFRYSKYWIHYKLATSLHVYQHVINVTQLCHLGFSCTVEPHLSGLFTYTDTCLGTDQSPFLNSQSGNVGVRISEAPL